MKIYVLRHGKTDWNKLGRIQGRTDILLNKEGKKQAEKVRKEIEKLDIDIIISSPLKRAMLTAEIINKNLNLPIKVDERIIERDYGKFEGRDKHEFDFSAFWDKDASRRYEDSETMHEMLFRIEDLFKEVKEKYSDKNILLVTHGGVIRGIRYIMDKSVTLEEVNNMSTKNCAIIEYEI